MLFRSVSSPSTMFCFSKGAADSIVGVGAVGKAPNVGVAAVVCPTFEPLTGIFDSPVATAGDTAAVVVGVVVGVVAVGVMIGWPLRSG